MRGDITLTAGGRRTLRPPPLSDAPTPPTQLMRRRAAAANSTSPMAARNRELDRQGGSASWSQVKSSRRNRDRDRPRRNQVNHQSRFSNLTREPPNRNSFARNSNSFSRNSNMNRGGPSGASRFRNL